MKLASNEISVEGGISDPAGRGAFDLLIKCKRFVLEELTRLTPRTRDLKLAGSGFFALSVTGTKEKPLFGGKLQFKGLGATVAELALADFTGTASFDERRIDVPNLKGKVADGTLTMDLTIKDYAKIPEIQVEASLDRFDLGRYLAAKSKLEADAKTAQAAKAAKTGQAAKTKPATPLRTRGKVSIGALVHPNAKVQGVTASWDLYGVTPDMRRLNGDAQIGVGGGTLHAIGDMATQSPIVKVLIFPILIVQKISRIVNLPIFPNFNDITVRSIVGDYAFKDGLMTLRRSEMDSNAAQVSATGTIDLPADALDLTVTAQVANVAPIDVAVTGTTANPKTKVKLAKFLATPAQQLIEGLLKR
ncbi:MAG: AsmA-like C-terminal region-containing protein [Elusimicrobia bacterium]|nr:AsmA-like C-terminal region-containing protein [Elusimicrobiota bacterium]